MADQSTWRVERTLRKLLVTQLASDNLQIKANKDSKEFNQERKRNKESNKEREYNSNQQQVFNLNRLQRVPDKLLQQEQRVFKLNQHQLIQELYRDKQEREAASRLIRMTAHHHRVTTVLLHREMAAFQPVNRTKDRAEAPGNHRLILLMGLQLEETQVLYQN